MVEEVSLEFWLRKINEIKNYTLGEIKHNDLMTEKYKNSHKILYHVEHLLILASTVTGCISISAFSSIVCVSFGIFSSALGIKVYAITAEIKKYKSIVKKKKKKHDEIVLLWKFKLNTIEALISIALMYSHISHYKFVSVNNVDINS